MFCTNVSSLQNGKGYKGRIGIYELINVTAEMRTLITKQVPVSKIREMARKNGNRSLVEDGLLKASRGVTTVEEVLRVCSVEDSEE